MIPMNKRPAISVLDADFLAIRHAILDVAAGLDRVDEAAEVEAARSDGRRQRIQAALAILTEPAPGRAERIQLAFSRPYEPGWNKA
jgi:hypothetical protein